MNLAFLLQWAVTSETSSDVIAAILNTEPPPARFARDVPEAVAVIIDGAPFFRSAESLAST
jgi:hypothetical protein